MADSNGEQSHVVIVGGGFAGLGCARELAQHDHVRVTLIDKNNYHQFQPLLYQVATSQLAPEDIAFPLRTLFRNYPNVDTKLCEVMSVDPVTKTVTTDADMTYQGDYVVLAAGSQPNFFRTPGAEYAFPLYSLIDAEKLRSRILQAFEDADRDPNLIAEGALNFVVVGGGTTGVETAGAIADLIQGPMAVEYRDLAVSAARVYVFDVGHTILQAFSENAHHYAATVLQRQGVQLRTGQSIKEIGPGHVTVSDGSRIQTRCVIWAGGIMAAPLADDIGLPQGRGGRINVQPDLTPEGYPGVYALGDFANIPSPEGGTLPQLGSVALQSGQWTAKAILADIAGKPTGSFHYHDKGIMAMISRNHAVAVFGRHHHELHGAIAYAGWLGVHVYLMTGVRTRIEAFVNWAVEYLSTGRGLQVLDRANASRIDWEADAFEEGERVGMEVDITVVETTVMS